MYFQIESKRVLTSNLENKVNIDSQIQIRWNDGILVLSFQLQMINPMCWTHIRIFLFDKHCFDILHFEIKTTSVVVETHKQQPIGVQQPTQVCLCSQHKSACAANTSLPVHTYHFIIMCTV